MALNGTANETKGRALQILLIGAGNMGFAMLRKWIAETSHQFSVVEPAEPLITRASAAGATAYSAAAQLPADFKPDVIVVATKPQAVAVAAATYAPRLRDGGMFVSVAAGVDIRTIQKNADRKIAIVRCMPNTPASIGEGMIVCCPNDMISLRQRELAERLMSAIGKVAFVHDEIHMDAVTAMSGSGPAYLFHFIEAMAKAGCAAGLDASLSMTLAQQTVLGAARLADQSDVSPSVLREQVTSPNGTTAAALSVLMDEEHGLAGILTKAVAAAKSRSIELGK